MPNLFPEGAGPGANEPGPLDFLRNQPQFQQLRAAVQQNPALLQPLLQQIGQANPQLLQLIQENQQEFLSLLEEDDGGLPPGANVIQVTPEERAAIERLEALGFDRGRVLEAFLACDRDETLAANYLFEHGNEED